MPKDLLAKMDVLESKSAELFAKTKNLQLKDCQKEMFAKLEKSQKEIAVKRSELRQAEDRGNEEVISKLELEIQGLEDEQMELRLTLFRSGIQEVLVETQSLKKQVEELLLRRDELNKKPNLTEDEREELKLLEEISIDLLRLEDSLEYFLEDLDAGKSDILSTGNLDLILAYAEDFSISTLDIILAAKTIDTADIEKLKNIYVSDTIIRQLMSGNLPAEYYWWDRNTDFESVASSLLRLFPLTKDQKKLIEDEIYKRVKTAPETKLPTGLLLEVDLPKEIQDAIIDKINSRNYFITDTVNIDIVGSQYLDPEQKQKLITGLIFLSDGVECIYLIKTYGEFFTEEQREMVKEKVNEHPYSSNLEFPSLYEIDPSTIREHGVRFVVHPMWLAFYQRPFDKKLWEAVGENGERYFEEIIVDEMKRALRYRGDSVSSHYFVALELIEELDSYRALARDKNKTTVFILPKAMLWVDMSDRDKAYVSALNGMSGSNTAYIESLDYNSGKIKSFNNRYIRQLFSDRRDVEVSGGLIGLCLSSSTEELNAALEERVNVNYIDSMPILYASETDPDYLQENVFLNDGENFKLKTALSEDDVISIREVRSIIDANLDLNAAYHSNR